MARAVHDPISVSDAVALAKAAVGAVPHIAVIGEVTGFRGPNARSGHCYFQIKDDSSTMDCIVWRSVHAASGVELRDGLEVLMTGRFDVYEATARMSFVATRLEATGEGALRQKVAALANRLKNEGLMDESRKKPVPRFCTRVAIVTSLSGDVIDDAKRTLARRNPLVELLVFGCSVQGAGAEATIIRALKRAEEYRPDCILLIRGGGTYEQLMTFNDEALVRTIASLSVPVVTGIGHEPDTTIADMVADRRQSTPTAAAESVAPAIDEIATQINERGARLIRTMSSTLSAARVGTEALSKSLERSIRSRLGHERIALESLSKHRCLIDPLFMIEDRRFQLEMGEERFANAVPRSLTAFSRLVSRFEGSLERVGGRFLDGYERDTERLGRTLEALSPLAVLSRGYALVRDEEGHVVTRDDQVEVGSRVDILLGQGSLGARVEDTDRWIQ
ncbi:MAG: exodeoxyribonuclease VII large subunit [Atopobiaceae bacterium]|nr:exodeoxyribonuclease VII large subunit [Atopobiaceae bacterium]